MVKKANIAKSSSEKAMKLSNKYAPRFKKIE
jgi:hypothetical protein